MLSLQRGVLSRKQLGHSLRLRKCLSSERLFVVAYAKQCTTIKSKPFPPLVHLTIYLLHRPISPVISPFPQLHNHRILLIVLLPSILYKTRILHPCLPQPRLLLSSNLILPPCQGGRDMYLEAENAWHMPCLTLLRDQGRVDLEENVVEGGAEVGAVDGGVARGLWVVDVLTFGAVHLHGFLVGDIGLAHGEEWVGVADYAGTFAEVGFFVFVKLENSKREFMVKNGFFISRVK